MDKNLSNILPNLVRFLFSSAMDIQNPKNRRSASFGALKPLTQKRSSKKRLLCPTLTQIKFCEEVSDLFPLKNYLMYTKQKFSPLTYKKSNKLIIS